MNFDNMIDSLSYEERVELLKELVNSFDMIKIIDHRRGSVDYISGSDIHESEDEEIIIRTDQL